MEISFEASAVKKHVFYTNGKAKTICSSNVLAYFGIDCSTYHYSACLKQIAAILRRNGWACRSRDSRIKCKIANLDNGKNPTIGSVRKAIKARKWGDPARTCYAVCVPGHILLLDWNGNTIVDTDPRSRDRRKVWAIRAIF